VVERQFELAKSLDAALATALERVRQMSTLTSQLERRSAERHPISGSVVLHIGGRRVTATLIDLSRTGLSCGVSPGSEVALGYDVRAEVSVGSRRFSVDGVVVRAIDDRDPTHVGVRFDDLAPESGVVLDAILDAGVLLP
jgi:hypothetical protein